MDVGFFFFNVILGLPRSKYHTGFYTRNFLRKVSLRENSKEPEEDRRTFVHNLCLILSEGERGGNMSENMTRV